MLAMSGVGLCAEEKAAEAPARPVPPAEVEVGERLFLETRFAQFFFAHGGANVNAPLKKGDPVLAKLAVAKGQTALVNVVTDWKARADMANFARHMT